MSALERPDDADQIAEALDASEHQTPGSGRNGGVPVVLPAACEGWRDRHAAGESIQSITDDHDWHYATVSDHVHGGCPHGAVRGGDPLDDEHNGGGHTGTTPPIAAVVDALETRAARSFGDTVYVTPGAFRKNHDIDATPRSVDRPCGGRAMSFFALLGGVLVMWTVMAIVGAAAWWACSAFGRPARVEHDYQRAGDRR